MSLAGDAALSKDVADLGELRSRYEAKGYNFTLRPEESVLPPFFQGYRPDAVARRADHNVAIQVKRQPSAATAPPLQDIRRLFEGHPDWQFNVIYVRTRETSTRIPTASCHDVRKALDEVRALLDLGYRRPAFVLAWSLLEATAHGSDEALGRGPHTPGTIVQSLVMNGIIGPDLEERLRALIDLRNRIVHGDVGAEPTNEETECVTGTVELILAAAS